MSKNLLNIFDITANRIRQVKDGAVNDIEDLYASKSDIQTVLDSKADQANTYTKQQIDANFYDITETYDKTEINVLSNNISSNSFLIGNLTITSNTNFNNVSLNTSLINNLNSTVSTNFNNISSNTNLINTNINNMSSNTNLINNLNSTTTSNFNNISSNTNLINTNINNISSNTNLINNLNSTVSTNFNNISSNSHLISQLQTGSFDSNLYYNKITTNNLLTDKLNTSILNNTLIHNITTTATFKIAEFGNFNNFFEMYNNYFDSYIYGSLTGATMLLNQRGFGNVEINNSSTFQNDKIILNHNTTILSNLQVSGLFSCSSILDITGSDARYVLQSDGLSGLITGNTNTINSIITNDSAQDVSISQNLDKVNTTAQTVNSPLILSLPDNTNPIFRIQDAVSNQRLEFKRGCQLDSYQGLQGATPYRLWLGWNTGDVIIGRPNNASRITINGNVHTSYNFAQAHGTSYFEGGVYMKGNLFTNNDFSTDIKTKIDNISTSINGLEPYLETYTPDAIEGFYIHHPNFVACSVGDITNASNQYFMCDGLVNKTIFNKSIDVLGNIWSNGNLTATGDINFSGVDKVVNLVNNTSLNFNDTASIQKYTLVATSSLYLMDNNQITLHIGDDPSIASNSYMLIDGNNTKIFVCKAMECQSTFATNGIQTYSGSDININSHLNVNTANKIIMGDVEISYFETPTVVKRMNFTNTDKDLGVLSFDFGETPDVDTTTVTMSYDNLSVFKPSFYYSNIVIDGGTLTTQDVVVSASNKINTRYIDSNAVLRLEASNSIDSYINGTKYLELDDTQFSSFNGFNLSSDRRLKDNIEDVDDDTINMVKNIKIKTFIKNQKTRKTELGWIAQDVQQYTNSKYNIVNDSGDYLTMCYDRMACISWDALSKLITRVEYLEEELLEKKKKKSK